ncbi:MAG: hypothetical protein PF450_03215 [Bacteroidales bacterium]|jgi:aspartate/glutamate racemase|nr:hypothetical protein [Bacteroidales bacterium]
MKTIGLIGGMSWESSIVYYELISDSDVSIPIFDTTTIHAEKAVEWALKNGT